jgi:Fe-S-cluster containining protein
LSGPPVRALSIHADYGCRHSGACCSSGWDIPVEPDTEERLDAAVADGTLGVRAPWSRPLAGLPHRARVVLRVSAAGECVFYESGDPRLCAVHRQLGPEALPSSCRQFPRVVTLTPRGVSVTLSHYCPTAAGLLFRDDVPLAVANDAPAFPSSWPYEGLDARDALPPFSRPGVLMSWAAHERFEAHAVATLAREELSPEAALARLAATAERIRAWTIRDGPFDAFAERVIEAEPAAVASGEPSLGEALADWERAAASIPAGVPRPSSPRDDVERMGLVRADALVGHAWGALQAPVRRWLAARAFGSWLALQGDGVRTTVAGLRLALGVLGAEAARGCAAGGRPLDTALLKEAIRRSDLLLHHLVDVEAFARDLSRCEARFSSD